jgi:hypothetical protein
MRGQETAIGKALWHQVTTVVILRKNMCQQSQTADDAALRTALVNMRYGACTAQDIKFLRSRICGPHPEQPKVSSKEFRNVPIICGVHTQKDMINQLGCQRFADETGQKLTNFYSVDKWGKEADPATKKKWGKSKTTSKLKHKSNEIDFDDQLEIWKVRHGATGHFPGKLSLCVGMPVIIKYNYATELCITNGQEGSVVGWQSTNDSHGKRVLDTLFVKLENPPQSIQIPGLPENVVPIVKSTKKIECTFPSYLKESITREQVWVLPNFAMTAHASQGKTCPYNVVHLNSCINHMSYYTALSRSASAEGTIIIQGFDSRIITNGCSGYLRQEFRELELLDDITRLRYESKLPERIEGSFRNALIHKFQLWKGIHYVPTQTDLALRWTAQDPLDLISVVESPWKLSNSKQTNIVPKSEKLSSMFLPAQGSQKVAHTQKHSHNEDGEILPLKKLTEQHCNNNYNGPAGIIWDGNNFSCAYDALIVILYDIWIQDPKSWSRYFTSIGNDSLAILSRGFRQFNHGDLSLENVRDSLRLQLTTNDPTAFPLGHRYASVGRLASQILRANHSVTSSQLICTNCDFEGPVDEHHLGYLLSPPQSRDSVGSTNKLVEELGHDAQNSCPECMFDTMIDVFYNEVPKLLVIEYPQSNIKTSHRITFNTDMGPVYLHLRGIVYHGMSHFTSRIITVDGKIWYHDGCVTHEICHLDGNLTSFSYSRLKTCKKRNLVLAVYAQI